MMNVLKKNIRYPAEARRTGVDGTVYVTFIVMEDGSLSDIKLLRGIGMGCDTEAIRVVGLLKKWYPATLRGRPVKVRFNLPIKFRLN